jgi:SAM-dependent methyltransferase
MNFFHKNDYKKISNSDLDLLKKKYSNVWKDETFPEKQWRRVENQLKHINDVPEFRAIIDMVKATGLNNPTVLEIGCSSGYLSKVLPNVRYEGTDYSSSFIKFAKQKFPEVKFTVNDATNLKYKDKSFDIVISGCCLLHIIDFKKAIKEAARVAKKYVIFHRTPVFGFRPTTFFTKTAYNAEMLEIVFNEDELIDIFRKNNLSVVKIKTISGGENTIIKNYLCKKT